MPRISPNRNRIRAASMGIRCMTCEKRSCSAHSVALLAADGKSEMWQQKRGAVLPDTLSSVREQQGIARKRGHLTSSCWPSDSAGSFAVDTRRILLRIPSASAFIANDPVA
jgi:hypothetical protein